MQKADREREIVLESRIFPIRGRKVMMDRDLAELYGVSTKALNQAVKRNIERFPEDFHFRLTLEEGRKIPRSQVVTLEEGGQRGSHSKYAPHVFTELGVAMLSSVLGSERAISANISIMRTFVKLRRRQLHQEAFGRGPEPIERKQNEQEEQTRPVFDTIEHLIEAPPDAEWKGLGFPLSQAARALACAR